MLLFYYLQGLLQSHVSRDSLKRIVDIFPDYWAHTTTDVLSYLLMYFEQNMCLIVVSPVRTCWSIAFEIQAFHLFWKNVGVQ